jgi:hypothetical protein
MAMDIGGHTEAKELTLLLADAILVVPRPWLVVTSGSAVPQTRPRFSLVEVVLGQLSIDATQVGRQGRRYDRHPPVAGQIVVQLGVTGTVPLLSGLELLDTGVAGPLSMIP